MRWFALATRRAAQIFDANGSVVPRNVAGVFESAEYSKTDTFGPGTPKEIYVGALSDEWRLLPGAYTLVVTVTVESWPPEAPQNVSKISGLSASTKFTVTP